MRALGAAWLLMCGALPAAAQQRPAFALRGDALMAWVHSDTGVGRVSLHGPGFAGEGRMVVNNLLFGLGLLEARLQPTGASNPQRDLVQGTVFVGARPVPWLEITAGPVIRAYATDSSTERWVFWQARARVDAPIVVGSLASHVEVWRALSSEGNLSITARRVQGAEAGVSYQPPRQRYWLRLAYRMDDLLLGSGGTRGGNETLETIALSLGLRLP